MKSKFIISFFEKLFQSIRFEMINKPISKKIVAYNPSGQATRHFDWYINQKVIDALLHEFPEAQILSEESGLVNPQSKPTYTFIIDPVDGSYNFYLDIPIIGFSIAINKGEMISTENIIHGFIGNFITGHFFFASKNEGAFKNHIPIQQGKFPFKKGHLNIIYHINLAKTLNQYPLLQPFLSKANHLRSLGSSIIELSYIIENSFLGYLNIRSSLTAENFLAASIILNEKGGKLTDLQGNPIHNIKNLKQGYNIIASYHHKYHSTLLSLFKK